MLVGAGLGLSVVSPFANEGISLAAATAYDGGLADCRAVAISRAGRLHGRPAEYEMGSTCTRTKSSSATLRTASSPGRWRHCSSPACSKLDHLGDARHRRSGCLQRGQRCCPGGSPRPQFADGNTTGLFRRQCPYARQDTRRPPSRVASRPPPQLRGSCWPAPRRANWAADDRAYLEKSGRSAHRPVASRCDSACRRRAEAGRRGRSTGQTGARRDGAQGPGVNLRARRRPVAVHRGPSSRAPRQRSAGACATTTKVLSTSDSEGHASPSAGSRPARSASRVGRSADDVPRVPLRAPSL